MRFFQQEGKTLKRTHLHESERVCECCESFHHGPEDRLHDDAVCSKCNTLCSCSCHREGEKQRLSER